MEVQRTKTSSEVVGSVQKDRICYECLVIIQANVGP